MTRTEARIRFAVVAVAAILIAAAARAACPAITLAPKTLSDATLNKVYEQIFVASGGTTPYMFALRSGSLPPGILLKVDRIVGQPTATGSFSFAISATDANNCLATSSYSLRVVNPAATCPAISIAPATLASATVGSSYSARFLASGGTAPYTYAAQGTIPPGLSLQGDTLSGVPTVAATYSFSVVATDANLCTATQTYAVDVASTVSTICPQVPPALIAPKAGATNTDPSVTFQWSSVTGAISYKLFTSVNGAKFEDIAETSDTTVTRIVPNGTIDWYVEADFAVCSPLRSAIGRFTVASAQCGGGSVTLIAPGSGATISSPVTFAWTPISGATAYRVWLALDNSAAAIVARVTSATTSVPLPSGAADWYVEALFDNCPSVVSSHGRFTIQKLSTCGTTSPAPTLISPISGDTSSPVTFSWNVASGAIAYRLWTAAAGESFSDAGFTTATQLSRELAPGTYTWYVDAIYSGCTPVSSTMATFRIPDSTAACSGGVPTLLAPANGAASVTSPVTFTWTPVANEKEYRVFASINGGAVQKLGSTEDTTLTTSVPPGTISWFIEVTFKGCPSTHSSVSRFTVPRATTCPTTKAQILSPSDGATGVTSPVTFSWSPVNGAVRYLVVAKTPHGAPTVIGETSVTQLERDVPAGETEWYVLALGAGCDPIASDRAGFTVDQPAGCDNKRPHPLSPADDSVDVASPVHFAWTKVAHATSYKLFVALDGDEPALVATSTSSEITVPMPAGRIRWFVQAVFDSCPSVFSALSDATIAGKPASCVTPARPAAQIVAQVLSATDYNLRWTDVTNASVYEVEESASSSFSGATTLTAGSTTATFNHTTSAPAQYFYRVRAISSCSDDRSLYSRVVSTRVIPPNTIAAKTRGTAEIGFQNGAVQTLTLPGSPTPIVFSATTDKPWITITPSSGTIPPTGLTLTITADPRALSVGANHGTIFISYPGGSSRIVTSATTKPPAIPISISLVTPVAPDTRASPPPDSLIIPAVAHGPGLNSLFQSDIRLTNASSQAMRYLINFTPSATDGTQTGTTTTIQVDPGGTTALDDILASFFGTASDGSATGTLEIRPLTSSSSSSLFSAVPNSALATVASSRTYNVTANGTFGQFIPAIPFSKFVGKGDVLSLQQIAESTAYRTNVGFVEAAGEPADLMVHVFDKAGNRLADIPQSLLPSEHLQVNGFLKANNISLDDGRIEVEVVSSTGKVTAYASVLDNQSNDPLLVSAVLKSASKSNRYVVPGVAYSNGIANWRTDMRLFNAVSSTVTATLTYSPQGAPGSPQSKTVPIAAGETRGLDNVLNTLFGITSLNAGGSVIVTTPATSNIIASARTYASTDNGTIGQFIPAVTPADAVGAGERSLQILQLEQSDSFRTNIGLAETTGNAATAEVSLILTDSKVTPVISFPLAPNEFVQFPLAAFGLTDSIYNARVSVKVVDGTGRVTAYGSLIDGSSSDPTYVPAQ